MNSVAAALREARSRGVDALDAQLMLARLLGSPRAWLIANDDAPLADALQSTFDGWLARRAAGEPLAYLFGEQEFRGLMLQVDARVLVPRPDTETLVDWGIELLHGIATPAVVDLGTGSGAIALAVKQAMPAAAVTAVDASRDALDVARGNAERLGLAIDCVEGDWWAPLPGRRFHLALSNPPYIADTDPHLAALGHEPAGALRSGADGLRDLRQIVARATQHLLAGGYLLLEHGWQQADAVASLLTAHGFDAVQTRRDLAGQPRCTGGRQLRKTSQG